MRIYSARVVLQPGQELNTTCTNGIMKIRLPEYTSSISVYVWSNAVTSYIQKIVESAAVGFDDTFAFKLYKNDNSHICIKNNTEGAYAVEIVII